MDIDQNKAVCRSFLGHMAALEVDKALDLVTEDVVWWVQGDWPGAGYHHGKQAVTQLFSILEEVLADRMAITFGDITAEADRVAVEMRSDALLRTGLRYRNSYHYLFTVRDGRIAHGREYLDTKHLCDVVLSGGG